MTFLMLWRLPLHETIFEFVKQKKYKEISVRYVSNNVAMTVATNELAETIKENWNYFGSNVLCKTITISATHKWSQCDFGNLNGMNSMYTWLAQTLRATLSFCNFLFLFEKTMANPTGAVDLLSDHRSWYRWITIWSKMSKQNKLFNTKTNDNAKNSRQWHVMLFTDFQLDQ